MSKSSIFEWDEENINHIARHRVSVEEVEYVLLNPTMDYGSQDWHEELRYAEVGQTTKGRILIAVTTERGSFTRVVTAYDADGDTKQEYLESR